jgi:cofilin
MNPDAVILPAPVQEPIVEPEPIPVKEMTLEPVVEQEPEPVVESEKAPSDPEEVEEDDFGSEGYNFEDQDSADEDSPEALQEKLIVPLSTDQIKVLIMDKLGEGVKEMFVPLRKIKCINFDKTGGLYIPLDCRD